MFASTPHRSAAWVALVLAAFVRQASAVDLEQRLTFDIAPQKLAPALLKFSHQAKVQVVVGPEVGDFTTQGVNGTQSIGQALSQLLGASALSYKVMGDSSIAVGSPTAAAEESSAAAVRVAQAGASAAAAQAPSPAPQEGGDVQDIKEIVVTAQRRAENLQDVPISISVLSGAQLDNSTYSGVTDALAQSPGIVTVPQFTSGSASYSVRGVGSGSAALGNGAGPLAYYIDGVPFGFVRNGFYPTDPSAYDLERVEVLYGPQGTLYGANALNGVIRVLTHDADPEAFAFKARTTVSGTNYGRQNLSGDAAINVPIIEDRLGARLVVGARDDSGWIDAPYGSDVNDAQSRSYRLRLRALPTDTLSLGLSVWRSESEFDAPPLSDDQRRIGTGPLNAGLLIPQPGEETFTAYGFDITKEFSNFSLSSTTSYLDYHSHIRPDGRPAGGPIALDNTFDSTILTQEINLTSSLAGPWRWSAGAFYRDATDDKIQYRLLPATLASLGVNDDFTDESQSYAVYGEVGRQLAAGWDLAVGLRYFHDEQAMHINQSYGAVAAPPAGTALRTVPVGTDFEARSEAVTPRVVLTWQPTTEHSLYASYSQGFRSGFSQQPRVYAAFDYAPVEPDRLTNYEIGAKGSIAEGRIDYEGAVYYIDWQDVQRSLIVYPDPVNLPNISATAVINGTSASGLGASFSLTTSPFEGLELGANVAWNDLTLDDDLITGVSTVLARAGDSLSLSPEYTAALSAQYRWDLGGGYSARVGASGNYIAAMQQDPPVSNGTDSINVVNTRFTIDTPDHWSASLFIDNLTDEYGSSGRVAPPTQQWSPRMRPRTYGLQLQYRL